MRGSGLAAVLGTGRIAAVTDITLPDVACSPVATIAVLFEKFKQRIAYWQSLKWVDTNYQNLETRIASADSSRDARHFDLGCRSHDALGRGRFWAQ